MNKRTLTVALLIVAALGVILFLARKNRRVLVDGLPPRIATKSEAEARGLAGSGAIPVLGTGSMAPFIPPAPIGLDPLTTVCAYVVISLGSTVDDVKPGALCIYAPDWAGRNVMHQAASFSEGGWIMTGLHNKTYENKERMTGRNFIGLVERVYVWPQ